MNKASECSLHSFINVRMTTLWGAPLVLSEVLSDRYGTGRRTNMRELYCAKTNLLMISKDYSFIGIPYFSNIDRNAIEKIVEQHSYSTELVFSESPWSSALRNYLVLTHGLSLINRGIQISEKQLLFNRYYWLKKFYHSYSRDKGLDAGIEQQISLLIETIGNKVNDFDWNELEKVNKLIDSQDSC